MILALLRTAAPVALVVAVFTHAPDRRVVDRVDVGNADSDARHGYDGYGAERGAIGGLTFRQTRGWIHYTMTTFDDTPVTIACTFIRADARDATPRTVDLVVEDSVVATRTVAVPADSTLTLDVDVPLGLTKGKTRVVVILRARDGLTPALRELRTIQDHYEVTVDGAQGAVPTTPFSRLIR